MVDEEGRGGKSRIRKLVSSFIPFFFSSYDVTRIEGLYLLEGSAEDVSDDDDT